MTRDGSFYLDYTENPNQRLLCAGDGFPVQGWMAQNGSIQPSTNVENIYLPAEGDMLPGVVTSKVSLDGILPHSATGADFNGNATRNLDIKGNLSNASGTTLNTVIYAPVTQKVDGNGVVNGDIQEIPVQISFSGPTYSPDGQLASWEWTMTTVDWPRAGDPPKQIYPPEGGNNVPGTVSFYTTDNPDRNRAAGQVASSDLKPGSSSVSSTIVLENGEVVETSFDVSSSFTLDVSRMTSLTEAPGGQNLETWNVDGNVTGSMARSITVYDQVTRFESVTNADGSKTMQAVRRVEPRQTNLQFAKTGSTDTETTWSWKSANSAANGALTFNTLGDLIDSTSSGGAIDYDFSSLQCINSPASVTASMQDGYVDGFLVDLSIDQNGRIFGHYDNNIDEPLAQLAMATVPNLTGLAASSGTLFYTSPSSGDIMIGVAGDENGSTPGGLPPIGAGSLSSQHLEGSNVQLSTEFTTLISTERGYQASARVISTTNEMLQQLVAMKR